MLFLAHKFFAFFQAVRLTLDVDNGAVMQYTIQDGGGDGDVGKDLVPLGESLVGGKNGGRFLIPSGNELEEQVCTLDVHGEVADFVNDEHPVLGQNLELIRQTVLKVGLLELFNELVAVDVVGGETVLCCHQAQGGDQMGLAHTGRAEKDYILPVLQETHGGKLAATRPRYACTDPSLWASVRSMCTPVSGATPRTALLFANLCGTSVPTPHSSALSAYRFGYPSTVLLSFSDALSGRFFRPIGSLSFFPLLHLKPTFFV